MPPRHDDTQGQQKHPGNGVHQGWVDCGVGHFEPKKGGIYSANNPVMPDFRWQPHDVLGRLRKMDKGFYRKVKKAATASPREWFDFTGSTIRNE